MSSFFLSEIYPCLQGEGASLGRPSVLVRLQGCNLRCTWCDSAFTQASPRNLVASGEGSTASGKVREMCVPEIYSAIDEAGGGKIKHVIVSGGEPTLQPLHLLMQGFGKEWSFEVETNGTVVPHEKFPDFPQELYGHVQWNVSPKGRSSGRDEVAGAIAFWADLTKQHNKVFLKFVVRREHLEKDVDEVKEICSRYGIDPGRVYLMSEGTTAESQIQQVALHETCLLLGFRYTPRLHILTYGNRRGV